MKIKKLFLLLFFGFLFSSFYAQTLYVRNNSGAQSAYLLSNIKKLTFSDSNLILTNASNSDETFSISDLRYLNFEDLTLKTTSSGLDKNLFYLYPNPVSTVLNISNQNPNQAITHLAIFSLEGRLILEPNLFNTNAEKVSVTSLPAGMYFCRITSNNKTQTLKFLKQ